MAQISITIPDAILNRAINGVASHHGYQNQIEDPADPGQMIPNPETKAQFAKRMIRFVVKSWIVQAEAVGEAKTARDTAEAEIDIQD